MRFEDDCFLGEIMSVRRTLLIRRGRAVNYGPAVFSLTCFVFLVIFVITNLIFQILIFYFK